MLSAARQQDAAFTARLVAGERVAWREFWQHYRNAMVQQIRMLAGPAKAHMLDEIVADIMVMLCDDNYRRLRMYDPARAAFSTYLHTVTRNATIDHLRRQRAGAATVSLTEITPVATYDNCHELLAAQSELRGLLVSLSPMEAQIIDALVGHGNDSEDVARLLGIDLHTVYSRKHKALRKLQRVALCATA